MYIKRKASLLLKNKATDGKVTVILGPRRVGKTSLLKEYVKESKEKTIFWNGEDFAVHELLKRRSVQNYKNLLEDCQVLIIDEAQKIPEIGYILKLIVDSIDKIKIVVTGSSAFDISNITGEPLTGRKNEIRVFPISEGEINEIETPDVKKDNLHQRLVFGNMPEIFSMKTKKEKEEYLRELVNSYLLKDILIFEKIKNSSKVFDLLKLIAFQIGSEVSLTELGTNLGISKNTVERYLDILSKGFILFKVGAFSRNLRKEIVKSNKWYFFDNGLRNAVIANMNDFSMRQDVGQLWEQYMINERLKYQNYTGMMSNNYFWRTYDQQEIDWIEDRQGILHAYEIKLKNQKVREPKAWKLSYPSSVYSLIHDENYLEWVTKENQ